MARKASAKPKPDTRPVGRPTKYEPRFCDMLVRDMKAGYSLTAFAGLIGVNKGTLNAWADVHPEFSDAVSRGKAARLRNWEAVALKMRVQGGGPGGATVTIFGLKNMGGDEWSDTQRHEMTGANGGPIRTEEVGARERIASRLARLTPGG